jgi:hypothetical protein
MKKYLPLPLILLVILCNLTLSCKSLPDIEPFNSAEAKLGSNFFLDKKYQLTHSIKAELPNGDKALLIGLTLIDPAQKSINAVIMTVEGFILFDVSYKDNTAFINRSMPDLDSSGFAAGLIDDLKLIFFAPDCAETGFGRLENKNVTRYKCKEGTVIDVLTDKNMTAEVRKYNSTNSLIRTVNFLSIDQQGLPEKIELIAHGLFGYSLYMELINVEKL